MGFGKFWLGQIEFHAFSSNQFQMSDLEDISDDELLSASNQQSLGDSSEKERPSKAIYSDDEESEDDEELVVKKKKRRKMNLFIEDEAGVDEDNDGWIA
jgi:hypothetical protein